MLRFMVGPDALRWSWVLLAFGVLLFCDGAFSWGMFQRDWTYFETRLPQYGPIARYGRMVAGSFIGMAGAVGLGYLAWSRVIR
jgi:hypothetical protein